MIFLPVTNFRYRLAPGTWSTGALAGLVGGAAEVAWIALYGRLSGGEAAAVARGVTDSLFPTLAQESLVVPLGIATHMSLAILLGVAITVLLRLRWPRLSGTAFEPVAVTGMLVAVWAMNFFVILPALNPAFVSLVPYEVSLISKVLFGVVASFVLQFRDRHCPTIDTPEGGMTCPKN